MGNLFKKTIFSDEQTAQSLAGTHPLGSAIVASPKKINVGAPFQGAPPKAVPTDLLDAHNQARGTAGLKPLRENRRLAELAHDWGVYLKNKENCMIRHPLETQQEKERYIPGNIGQNLYVGHGYPENPTNPKAVVSAWYDECRDYTPPKGDVPHNFKEVGHFTQLMWKDASQVGCAKVDCPRKMRTPNGSEVDALGSVVVCNYDKGNVGGEFPTQVVWTKCPINFT